MAWVTLEQAQAHLKIPFAAEDADLELKIAQAEALIREYLERSDDATWTAELDSWNSATSPTTAVPAQVTAAVLYQVGELYRWRGDDPGQPEREPGHLSSMVRALLARKRDPVLR